MKKKEIIRVRWAQQHFRRVSHTRTRTTIKHQNSGFVIRGVTSYTICFITGTYRKYVYGNILSLCDAAYWLYSSSIYNEMSQEWFLLWCTQYHRPDLVNIFATSNNFSRRRECGKQTYWPKPSSVGFGEERWYLLTRHSQLSCPISSNDNTNHSTNHSLGAAWSKRWGFPDSLAVTSTRSSRTSRKVGSVGS